MQKTDPNNVHADLVEKLDLNKEKKSYIRRALESDLFGIQLYVKHSGIVGAITDGEIHRWAKLAYRDVEMDTSTARSVRFMLTF
jgi:hypothetical protein